MHRILKLYLPVAICTLSAWSQNLPVDEQFSSALNTNIWQKYLYQSDLIVANSRLYYVNTTTNSGSNDAVLICKIPLTLSKSWVSEFWINTGSARLTNNNAFKKAGFLFVNATNTNQVLSFKAYDEGVDGTNKIPYAKYENSFNPIKTEGTSQLTMNLWQSNSWYPTNVKAKASWCASTRILKVSMADPYTLGYENPIASMELGEPFYNASNIVVGIILKLSYQSCGLGDNFYLSRIKIAEGCDLSLVTSGNLSDPISFWQTSATLTEPMYNSKGFYRLLPPATISESPSSTSPGLPIIATPLPSLATPF